MITEPITVIPKKKFKKNCKNNADPNHLPPHSNTRLLTEWVGGSLALSAFEAGTLPSLPLGQTRRHFVFIVSEDCWENEVFVGFIKG